MTNAASPVLPTNRRPNRISCLGVLAILIVVVAVINLALAGIRALAKPSVPPPGTLLYATQFSDPSDPNWFQYAGPLSTEIKKNALLITADSPKGGTYSDLNYTFNNFDVRVVVALQTSDDPFNEYGILFRYQDKNNYYMFRIRADGNFHIARVVNGKQEDLSAPHPAPGIAAGPNHINDLRVTATGDHFQFYVNGQLLTLCPKGSDKFSTWNGDQCLSNNKQTTQTLIDGTFGDGRIALGAYENDSTVQVAFSNLVIYSPSA